MLLQHAVAAAAVKPERGAGCHGRRGPAQTLRLAWTRAVGVIRDLHVVSTRQQSPFASGSMQVDEQRLAGERRAGAYQDPT